MTALVAALSFGCTDCSPRDGVYALGRVAVVTPVPLDVATTTYRYHCWANANGPRVDFWSVTPTWRVPGTALSAGDVTLRSFRPASDATFARDATCDADACPSVWLGDYGSNCGSDVCPTFVHDFEIEIVNPSAIPVGGIQSEIVITADFYEFVPNGSDSIGDPAPLDADISDITTDIGCALVLP